MVQRGPATAVVGSLLCTCLLLTFILFAAKCTAAGVPVKDSPLSVAVPNEFCCCSTDTVDANTESVLKALDSVVQRPYFRYFKVNVHKPCDYWAVSTLCTSAGNPCQVCRCSADEIPFGLREEPDMGCPSESTGLPELDRSGNHGMAMDSLWNDLEDSDAEYIDLVKNPEGNTGYVGELANRIWDSIYRENCFPEEEGDQCKQQMIFYKLISGMHASISTHISARFLKGGGGCGPDCDQLTQRVTDHPTRVENLYTLYQFLLRAVARVQDHYLPESGSTYPMDPTGTEDLVLKEHLNELFHNQLLCSKTFNETKVLESPEGRALIPEMKRMMLNITTLMDCLTCEKCRVWGKVQTMGLTTAFKIIVAAPGTSVSLSRAEKVTLMNFLRQVAFSVRTVKSMCPAPEAPAPDSDAHRNSDL